VSFNGVEYAECFPRIVHCNPTNVCCRQFCRFDSYARDSAGWRFTETGHHGICLADANVDAVLRRAFGTWRRLRSDHAQSLSYRNRVPGFGHLREIRSLQTYDGETRLAVETNVMAE
jgi:hypothetical protein